jgi:putative Holliday junction resolvase
VDFGKKRIGLAVSDPSALMARPWRTVESAGSARRAAEQIARLVLDDAELADPLDEAAPIAGIVVGLPRRLDGTDTHMTGPARDLAAALQEITGLVVHLQDERLTSREAEALLAEREPDWRERKRLLDAASAAIILQDFLDHRATRPSTAPTGQAGA